jgi:hypothetical protein
MGAVMTKQDAPHFPIEIRVTSQVVIDKTWWLVQWRYQADGWGDRPFIHWRTSAEYDTEQEAQDHADAWAVVEALS